MSSQPYSSWYTGRPWRRASKAYLVEHPWCVMCEAEGRHTIAAVVDHKVPHKGDKVLFWDESNWQGLCQPHHDRHKQSFERTGKMKGSDVNGWPLDPNHPCYRGGSKSHRT